MSKSKSKTFLTILQERTTRFDIQYLSDHPSTKWVLRFLLKRYNPGGGSVWHGATHLKGNTLSDLESGFRNLTDHLDKE